MAGFIENLDFVTICKIVQTWCSRNNTVNVAYVPCYCRQNSDDWIKLILDELLKQYIYMKVCHNTTPENSLKYFDHITDI